MGPKSISPRSALAGAALGACFAVGCAAEIPGGGPPAGPNEEPPDTTTATSPTGVVALRRLNRTEYANTLRDLVGTAVDHGANFPTENLSFGFDNVGEALTIQPLHMELYESTAEAVIDELFARPTGDPLLGRVMSCDPATQGRGCAEHIVRSFAERAYRRRVVETDYIPFVNLAETYIGGGATITDGMKLALKGILLSPHFIFKVERDPDPNSSAQHALSGFELATRLSYFVWSTMPDDALFGAADSGALATDETLASELARMLADPKAGALVDNFAGQWLNLRRVSQVTPDYTTFPSFDDELKAAMGMESALFFNELLQNARPLTELMTASYTFVNARLAQHYGLPAPAGSGFQRVELSGTPRVGFLSQASYLTLTSNPTRTSPVKRGKWVLDQLLCSPPPPPPPGVDTSIDTSDGAPISLRARLEQHREQPICAGCHSLMDPIGLGFENFDGIGAYRAADEGGPIDASGTLPGGTAFNGPAELAPLLAADERFMDCAADKVLTYAVGRGADEGDDSLLSAIVARAGAQGGTLRAIIEGIVTSEAFRQRRAVSP